MITVSKFNVRIVNKGDTYGRNFCLTHNEDGDKAMVEFYDARHANTVNKFGQFVSRYYVGTLLCKEGFYGNSIEGGLCLDGGSPDEWSVNAEDMKTVRNYISGVTA
jgi:hypothetical protein